MTESEANIEYVRNAKESMRTYLRAKSWLEKVRSIERMNLAMKAAQKAMREHRERQSAMTESSEERQPSGTPPPPACGETCV